MAAHTSRLLVPAEATSLEASPSEMHLLANEEAEPLEATTSAMDLFADEKADSLEDHDNSIRFWRGLSQTQREALAKVTEDMPIAVRDLAGIMSPYSAMMRGSAKSKIFMTLFLMLRMVTNTVIVSLPAYHQLKDGHHLEFNFTHSSAVVDGNTLTMCHEKSVLYNATNQTTCIKFHHSPEFHGLIVILEALVVIPASLATLGFSLRFLCLSDKPRDGHEEAPPRAEFVEERPFLFVFLPKLGSAWSMMSCLMFVNASFTTKFFTRGDFELYAYLFLQSLSPKLAEASWRYIRWRREKKGVLAQMCCRIPDICIVMALISLGVMSLHLKFLKLYFATSVSLSSWDWHSWGVFLGFTNQLVGLFDSDLAELSRCLLMKFGGSDSRWSVDEMTCVHEYFGLLFGRFVEGRLQGRTCSGLQALAALVTFSSDTLQQLLLSSGRSDALRAVRGDRLELLDRVLDEGHLERDRDDRIGELETYQAELVKKCDFRKRGACEAHLESAVRTKSCEVHLEQAERIRALAQIQSYTARLMKSGDGQSPEVGSAPADSKSTETSISICCGLIADQHASSADVHDSTIRFWNELDDNQKINMAKVIEDVPMAVRDLAGVMCPYSGIMRKSTAGQFCLALLLMSRVVVNTVVVSASMYHYLADGQHHVFSYPHSRAIIDANHLTVCHTESTLSDGKGEQCLVFHHSPEFYGLIIILEALVVISASLATFGFSFYFLYLSDQPRDGRNRKDVTPPRAKFVEERPFVFVLLPKLASSWSLMSCLILLNAPLTMKLFKRGDVELYSNLLLQSLCPSFAAHCWDYVGWRRKHSVPIRICCRVLDVCFVSGLVFFGIVAMLIKLLKLYFATSVDFTSWDWRSWGVFLGFINQVVGIFDFDFVELSRCLLMKFGGSDSQWDVEEMQCVPEYFGLVFSRFVQGRLQHKPFAGLRAWVGLVTFTSDNLQKLLLSKSRAHALRAALGVRLEILEVFLDKGNLERNIGERICELEKYQEHLAALCGLQMREGRCPGSDLTWETHLKQAESIRAVAQIQSHIANLQENGGDDSDFESVTMETTNEDSSDESDVELEESLDF